MSIAAYIYTLLYVGVVTAVVLGILLFTGVWRPKKLQRPQRSTANTPVILSAYTVGVSLEKMWEGTIGEYPARIVVTMPLPETLNMADNPVLESYGTKVINPRADMMQVSPTGVMVMTLDLPFRTQVHFAGFSAADPTILPMLGNIETDDQMQQMHLEGTFPDYFRLYCDKDHEIELLQLLDPTRMQLLLELAQSYHWELLGNSLFFAATGQAPADEQGTTMVNAAKRFADELLTELRRMADD